MCEHLSALEALRRHDSAVAEWRDILPFFRPVGTLPVGTPILDHHDRVGVVVESSEHGVGVAYGPPPSRGRYNRIYFDYSVRYVARPGIGFRVDLSRTLGVLVVARQIRDARHGRAFGAEVWWPDLDAYLDAGWDQDPVGRTILSRVASVVFGPHIHDGCAVGGEIRAAAMRGDEGGTG